MSPPEKPNYLVLLNLDGLRRDVWNQALQEGSIPHLASLLGGHDLSKGVQFDTVSTAPSITYCSQATLVTGAHPKQHGIPGNQFYDRFGYVRGEPNHFAFDAGGSLLALDDAIGVYRSGLAGRAIQPGVETLYESAKKHGGSSAAIYHMYAKGADHWVKPDLEDFKHFMMFDNSLGFSSVRFDESMVKSALEHIRTHGVPQVLMLYFWGLDHESHIEGPSCQHHYLTANLDPLLEDLIHAYQDRDLMGETLFAIFSDHGQIEVVKDALHCLELGMPPFNRGMRRVFNAFDLDVIDLPGEDQADAVLSMNGGMAHLYVRHASKKWDVPAQFEEHVMPLAEAFWQGTSEGKYYPDLKNALDMVLVRNIEREGWEAPYLAYTPYGLVPVEEFLEAHPHVPTLDPVNRLNLLTSPNSGDILLFTNYAEGYYFAFPYRGVHGGLHPEDSQAILAYGMPGSTEEAASAALSQIEEAIRERCGAENDRQVSIADMAYGLRALMGWL